MLKKKLLAMGIGCLILISSVTTAFAAENLKKDPAVKQARIEAKRARQAEKLSKFEEKAVKLGITIEGLSLEEAKEKIKETVSSKKAARMDKLNEKAAKLGVDISGLTIKDAVTKIKEAKAIKQAEKTANNKLF